MEHLTSMRSKPCLIFNAYPLKVTDGGPSGFLAQNLAGTSSENYRLSEMHQAVRPQNRLLSLLHRQYSAIQLKRAFRKIGLPSRGSWFFSQLETARRSFQKESGQDYAWIWFHDVTSLFACMDLLDARQNVILQPHCPELPSDEVVKFGGRIEDVGWVKQVERTAFARANICVLPNKYVVPIYASLLRPETRIEYLLSGCRQMKAKGLLPLDPKYVYYLYLGRRMAIKGFDVVLEAFQKAHAQDSSLRLVVVGKGDQVNAPGVIDVGFSEEPAMWLESCDYLISANRQSYFDLSVMESLSVGIPLIVSCTGGHFFFKDCNSEGVYSLPDAEVETLAQALLINRKKGHDNKFASAANQKLFREQFESRNYRIRLDRLLAGILEMGS